MEDKIFSVSPQNFEDVSLEIFRFQYNNNQVYHSWVDALKVNVSSVRSLTQIPFLPIHFFKTHKVITGGSEDPLHFESSGTTGLATSRHYVLKPEIYQKSFLTGFEHFYGAVNNYCILGLLPSYLERKHSSLVMMVDGLLQKSKHPLSGFYLYDHEKLRDVLLQLQSSAQQIILIGVTYALLDFAEKYPMDLNNIIIMETGGMKGKREELTRMEVHKILKSRLGVSIIHSEYGMTELLSQAYSSGAGLFETPPWMRILLREPEDPMNVWSHNDKRETRGAINIIDLANLYSCSFIASDDLGTLSNGGGFTVDGRLDNSDIRGCSLLAI